jgi:hypothetical protein
MMATAVKLSTTKQALNVSNDRGKDCQGASMNFRYVSGADGHDCPQLGRLFHEVNFGSVPKAFRD